MVTLLSLAGVVTALSRHTNPPNVAALIHLHFQPDALRMEGASYQSDSLEEALLEDTKPVSGRGGGWGGGRAAAEMDGDQFIPVICSKQVQRDGGLLPSPFSPFFQNISW